MNEREKMDGNNFNNNNNNYNSYQNPNRSNEFGYSSNASMGYQNNTFMNNDAVQTSGNVSSEDNKAGKVFSIIGFCSGIAALILGVCPCAYIFGPFLGLTAVIFSILGLVKKGNKIFATIGLVCGGIGFVVSIIFYIIGFINLASRPGSSVDLLMNYLGH